MARETQKAKIERLEKENAELKSLIIKSDEQIKKLQAENKRLKAKRKIKADENNLELIDQQLQKAQNNSDRWHSEFFKEQQKNKELENEIQKLKDENKSMKTTLEINEEFYKDDNTMKKKLEETLILSAKKNQIIKKLEYKIQKLESKKVVSKKIKNERGAGRKNKFNDQEIETIKVMRLRGDTIKDIAEQFQCSVGLIHKIIHESEEK